MSDYWEDRVHSLDMDLENARAEIQWLKDKLQKARIQGWEQCQMEAQTIVEQSRLAVNPLQTIRLRLSAMEYKEI